MSYRIRGIAQITWQKGLSKTPFDKQTMNAALPSMPLRMPSLVRSSARLSYHTLKPIRSSSR